MSYATKNVLIVDDDPRILRSLRNGFRRQPLRVFTAGSAVKAMEVLGSERIDAVVCDQRMPGASGVDLLECIASESPQTVRVMLSGDGRFTTALEAINRAQVARFLAKPCPATTVAQVVADLLADRAGVEDYVPHAESARGTDALVQQECATAPELAIEPVMDDGDGEVAFKILWTGAMTTDSTRILGADESAGGD